MSSQLINQYTPETVTPPGYTLQEVLEDRGMSQAEFADRTGHSPKTINEIIKGKAPITPETAIQFERVLGIQANFWNNREKQYRESLARQAELDALARYIPWMRNFPINEMIKLGWIEKQPSKVLQLETVLHFFGIGQPSQWEVIWQSPQIAKRQSQTFVADPYAISAWIRQCEIEAQKIVCGSFSKEGFTAALQTIRSLTSESPEDFAKVQRLCAAHGVALVFVPEISGTRLSGATLWLPSKALIMLSSRYKTDDQIWFTFFHEAGHILLHGKKDRFLEGEGYEDSEVNDKEAEANKFAANFLIPPAEYESFYPTGLHYSHEDIQNFAARLGIAPGIVVGRLQHDRKLEKSHCNHLKRRIEW